VFIREAAENTGQMRFSKKINYDNMKKMLILQPARLSKSLQSYLKPILEYQYDSSIGI